MELLLLTSAMQPTTEVLPGLGLLAHSVTVLPFDAAAVVERTGGDLVLLDARRDLAAARSFTRVLTAIEMSVLRVLDSEGRNGPGKPDPVSSVLKLKGSELQQVATELLVDVPAPELDALARVLPVVRAALAGTPPPRRPRPPGPRHPHGPPGRRPPGPPRGPLH